jgi:hypothetical protein
MVKSYTISNNLPINLGVVFVEALKRKGGM